jgi:small subunit ribosomal protein S16
LAVRIRLTRVGATKRPSYRVVAIDKRRARDGRALEILGFYDPLTDPATVKLEADRIQAWISKGAQPSETVVKLLRQAEKAPAADAAAPKMAEKPKPARARKPKQAVPESADTEPTVAGSVDPEPTVADSAGAEPAASEAADAEPAKAEA